MRLNACFRGYDQLVQAVNGTLSAYLRDKTLGRSSSCETFGYLGTREIRFRLSGMETERFSFGSRQIKWHGHQVLCNSLLAGFVGMHYPRINPSSP